MSSSPLFSPFTLPNGSKLKNRIVKAAMEENMADVPNFNQPSSAYINLYRQWGKGGAGLILTGHVMIDPLALSGPGTVLLAEDVPDLNESKWKTLAQETQSEGAQCWLQINHPGRQIKKGAELPTYGPSAIPIDIGKIGKAVFETPYEMSEAKILDVIERFTWTARKAEELGFKGVEIHAAHGYLISQFLSPLSNMRPDRWGGSLENRARLLFEVVRSIREAVSPSFGVGVKINSADFQRGGFDSDDLRWVVQQLNTMSIDLIELSGGNVESPAMAGAGIEKKAEEKTERTRAREAYFIEAAEELRNISTIPIVVTGGIRTLDTADAVVHTSPSVLVGIGSALGFYPDLPQRWLQGENPIVEQSKSWLLPRMLTFAAGISQVQYNMQRIGEGRKVWMGVWPVIALVGTFWEDAGYMKAYKKWIGKMLENSRERKEQ